MERNGRKLKVLQDEEWRVVPNSDEKYWVSNYGRVKSYMIKKTDGELLKQSIIKNFRFVNLTFNSKHRTVYVHKLVASVWLDKPTDQHTIVTHLDRNLKNNQVSNLKWITLAESNSLNATDFKQKYSGKRHPRERHNTKLKEQDIIQLKIMLSRGLSQAKIAKMFCISEMQVTRIKRGENWGDVKIPESK